MTEKPKLVVDDPWLEPHQGAIERRMKRFSEELTEIEKHARTLAAHATGHKHAGIHFRPTSNEWTVREWAPHAQAISLIGDFNNWNRDTHPLESLPGGVWELKLPPDALAHGQKVKLHVVGADGSRRDRIPACIRRAVQDPTTHDYSGQIWNPPELCAGNMNSTGARSARRLIYESHVGMGGEEPRVHTYREFAETVLPRVAKAGYNTVQLMAVQEHPYYGSFGYHVSSFFAPCSRFGTPEDLKYLIDTAHGLGIAVLLDIVHSHAVKNLAEGSTTSTAPATSISTAAAAANIPRGIPNASTTAARKSGSSCYPTSATGSRSSVSTASVSTASPRCSITRAATRPSGVMTITSARTPMRTRSSIFNSPPNSSRR
jgi:1,4-alpha-glucan branching enzyme